MKTLLMPALLWLVAPEFMRLVGTVIRSRNVGRQMAVVETWMEVGRLAFPVDMATTPGATSHRRAGVTNVITAFPGPELLCLSKPSIL